MGFDDYYQAELTYLREMGRAFAHAHPAVAGLLGERGTDPDVERLLEGFAFLAGRIHQRIDAALPTLIEGLGEMLFPHFCRTAPACTTIEFDVDPARQRGRQKLPAGARLRSRAVAGTQCEFRTCTELDIVPVRITQQRLDDSSASRPELSIQLALAGGRDVFGDAPLRLHAHGDLPLTSHLMLWILRHCIDVVVEDPSSHRKVSLGRDAVRWSRFCCEAPLWPWSEASPRGIRLLAEFFSLPSKFLYFDVHGLSRARDFAGSELKLTFVFDRPPSFPGRLPQDILRVNCVPAANVLQVDAIPISTGLFDRAHLLRAEGIEPTHAEVFSVDRVFVTWEGSAPRECHSFYSFRSNLGDPRAAYYVVNREASPVDDGIHHYMRLSAPRDQSISMDRAVLSVELTCTNRSLPDALRVGDVDVPTPSSPTGMTFRNIERVTRPARLPLGGEMQWRLLGHLAASQRSLGNVDVLKAILGLYNWQEFADVVVGRSNERRISAIQAAKASPTTRVVQGAAIRGLSYRIEFDETGFSSFGDAFLFGCILDELLAAQAPINSFSELVVGILPSGKELRWTPRTTA